MKKKKKEKEQKKSTILRFYPYTKGFRLRFLLSMVMVVISVIANYMTPQVIRVTVDSVINDNAFQLPGFLSGWIASIGGEEALRELLRGSIAICAAVSLGFAAIASLSSYSSRMNLARACEGTVARIRDTLFGHIQRLPYAWHNSHQTGDIIQRCTMDVDLIRNFVSDQLMECIRIFLLIVVSLGLMFAMNARLSLLVTAFIPVVFVTSFIFFGIVGKKFQKADETEGELTALVQENLTGVRVVRAFGREQFEMDRFQEKNEAFARLWIRLGTLSGLYWGVGDLITGLQVATVVVLGAVEAVHGQMSVGEFVAFASYNTVLVWPVRGLGRILSDMSKAGVSFERVGYIIHGEEETYVGGIADAPEEFGRKSGDGRDLKLPERTDIAFSHVSFAYGQGEKVLHDVSFTIPQGTTFGILGGTGSGKSTIVQLLTRLYELEEGTITLGGVDIRKIPLDWLRRRVGMVLQEPFLYSRTIRENIAAAAKDASMEEIESAAWTACVDRSIRNFADGYETLVGERGVTLSGGQRQRVAIARMLLQQAPVMVFDDSLSAVDTQTDHEIRQALKRHMQDATVILISHRITTLMGADRILVLNQGRVEETGTHEELIRRDGIYRQNYKIQMEREAVSHGSF